MQTLYTEAIQLTVLACPVCGVRYAIPEEMRANAYKKGDYKQMWYCPNGHELGYGEGEAQRLQKRLEMVEGERDRAATRALRAADQRDAAERSRAAMKGVATKAKKRVGKGVCPCCNRHFTNVQRHMEGQHPDYATAPAGEAEA